MRVCTYCALGIQTSQSSQTQTPLRTSLTDSWVVLESGALGIITKSQGRLGVQSRRVKTTEVGNLSVVTLHRSYPRADSAFQLVVNIQKRERCVRVVFDKVIFNSQLIVKSWV